MNAMKTSGQKFAIVNGSLVMCRRVDDDRDHKTWLDHEGLSKHFDRALCGLIEPEGIYVFSSSEQRWPQLFAADTLAEQADLLEVPPETQVWNGMRPIAPPPATRWEPITKIGTVGELLAKRVVVQVPVRIRPELAEKLRAHLGSDEAVAKLIRRAIGDAETATRKLFQDECQTHDWKKIASGQQSSELFECTRCEKQTWD